MTEHAVTPRRALPPVPPTSRGQRQTRVTDTGRHAAVEDPALAAGPLVDSSPETGRHADLTRDLGAWSAHDWTADSGRHAAVDDQPGDDADPGPGGPETHHVVVARPSHRRWVPLGVGSAVLALVSAVLLTSGLGAERAGVSTDEAARTGTVPSPAAVTTTEAALPLPTVPTIVITPGTPSAGAVAPQPSSPPSTAPSPRTDTQTQAPVVTLDSGPTGVLSEVGTSADPTPQPEDAPDLDPVSVEPPVTPPSTPTDPTTTGPPTP